MRCSVDGRPNRNNKVAFSNLSGIVWTRPNILFSMLIFSSSAGAGGTAYERGGDTGRLA